MNILVAVEELRIGGAQTFALRLAQSLHEAGHSVYLYNMYWQYTEHDLVKRLAPDVELIQYQPSNGKLDTLLLRSSGWMQRHGWSVDMRAKKLQQHLQQVIRDKRIDVVSSHTFKCDYLFAHVLRSFPHVPLIVTMHGDYEQFLAFNRQGGAHVIPDYLKKLKETVARINGVAYLSEQNLEALEPSNSSVPTKHIQVRRIYNGLDGKFSDEAQQYTRAALKIEPDAFVFGMVARGVPEKGWEPVIQAYKRLKAETARPMHLVLVGSSSFLLQLEEKYKGEKTIHFLGFVNNPIDCVASFNVGILASSLKESLPNSIAEYLFCGKPTISTDVGEIRQMIRTDEGEEAGILIDFPESGLASEDQLYQAMQRYATNPEISQQHQQLALAAFEKFNMSNCVNAYTSLYQDCQQQLVKIS